MIGCIVRISYFIVSMQYDHDINVVKISSSTTILVSGKVSLVCVNYLYGKSYSAPSGYA